MTTRKNHLKFILLILLSLAILIPCMVLFINFSVRSTGKNHILPPDQAAKLADVDCILVLGCHVYDDGTPSPMLRDRLQKGVELYAMGASRKLLMSGDHGRKEYNEVDAMKQYAIDAGIDSSDVFMDHAGFSTYESIYRAKEIFGVKKMIIVTQNYHLYRALYIAQQLGIEAYGVDADTVTYPGQFMRECREILARVKDFGTTILKPKPTYLGEAIPVNGDGDITNDV